MPRPIAPVLFLLILLLSLIAPTWSGARSTSGYQALFDGRASRMKSIDPLGGSGHQEQQPFVWDCLCYVHGNVKLVPDSRYGKAYRYSTDGSSWNGFGYDPGPERRHLGPRPMAAARSRPLGLVRAGREDSA